MFGVMTDHEYTATHKRSRITVWSGSFAGVFEAEGYSLPKGDGYSLTTYNGDKLIVRCGLRTVENHIAADKAINTALNEHYAKRGVTSLKAS